MGDLPNGGRWGTATHTREVSFTANIFEVFIASPGDLAAERAAVTSAIEIWNRKHAAAEHAAFVPVRWEWAVALQGAGGQDQINEQQVRSSDVVLALFKDRLGLATEHYPSGTAEEIALGVELGKTVSILLASHEDVIPREQAAEVARLDEYMRDMYKNWLSSRVHQ